eukprot:m.96645 g.96645  ORF g.96645 m.96645 type:complete len:629 (+) comp18487_c0_seq1:262-2148(+)
MTSLKQLVRETIREEVIKPVRTEFKLMIVDSLALRLLSATFRMSEIIDLGITVVEDLHKGRKPLTDFHGIYLCAPTSENVEHIRKDFEDSPTYGTIHVFFLDVLPDSVFSKLATPSISKVMKTLKELSMLFVPLESQVFSLDDEFGFYDAYSRNSRQDKTTHIAAVLGSLCATLEDSPIVRYPSSSDKIATLAAAVQQRLDFLRGLNPKMKTKQRRSQIILLDRPFDLYSPLVHELTYQAAAYDLLSIEKDTYSYKYEDSKGRQQTRQTFLAEEDDLWRRFRHEHISRVFRDVSKSLQEFASKKQQLTSSAGSAKDTKDIKEIMKQIPQHQEQMAKYSLHLDLASNINKAFNLKVEKATMAEQNMVMGETPEGMKVRDFIDQISSVILSDIGEDNKLRLLMLCVIAKQGLKSSELQQLLDKTGIPEPRHPCVTNLESLGVPVVVTKTNKTKPVKRPEREIEFNLSRWTPLLKDIAEDAIKGKLDLKSFPCTRDAPALAEDDDDGEAVTSARKGGWAKKRNKEKESADKKVIDRDRPNLILFVQGCISFNEMRAAYEVAKAYPDWDVYIGSQTVATPVKFINMVGSLSKPPPEKTLVRPATGSDGLAFVTGNSRTDMGQAASPVGEEFL